MLASYMFFLRGGVGTGLAPGWAATDPVTVSTTVAKRKKFNVTGNRWHIRYSVSGDSGYTLATRLLKIDNVLWNDVTITKVSWDNNGNITFVSSGAFTDAEVIVSGNQ